MITYEFKVKRKDAQNRTIDEAICTRQFIKNKGLPYWVENAKIDRYDLDKYCAPLASKSQLASELNSLAHQSSAEWAWPATSQFYGNSHKRVKGNKGFSKFKTFKKAAKPPSKNYLKARNRYARKHVRASRTLGRTLHDWQRKEYCKRVAYSVTQSNELVAYENLKVKGLVRNRHLAKSIDVATNILKLALSTVGHTGTYAWGDWPSWATGDILLSNGESLNQESHALDWRGSVHN